MIDSTRQYPRTLRQAFPQDYRESAMGIEQPIQTAPTLLERFLRLVREIGAFLMQKSPWQ